MLNRVYWILVTGVLVPIKLLNWGCISGFIAIIDVLRNCRQMWSLRLHTQGSRNLDVVAEIGDLLVSVYFVGPL